MKLLKLCTLAMLILCSAVNVGGCGRQNLSGTAAMRMTEESQTSGPENVQEATDYIFAMDTYMTVTAYGENAEKAVDDAKEEIRRLDELLSTENAGSQVSRLNEDGTADLSEDTGYLLEKSMELYDETEGAFDIAIYPVTAAWGFPTKNFRIPEAEELHNLLMLADMDSVFYDTGTRHVSFAQKGMKIDFGGIAKGYTSAKIMEIYKKHGIQSGLVNLGGNVQVFGRKPDGSKWNVAVQNPEDPQGYLGVIPVENKAVVTSGTYERFFEENGVVYHHMIDPKTGYPAQNGLVSVTVVSEDGTLADGLSTSLFIMGREKAQQYWREHKGQFDVIFMEQNGELYVTEGLSQELSTERTVHVLR